MTDDEAFVRAIVAAPADDAPRLVYADWLDERGDPRGDYLREELKWAEPWKANEVPTTAAPSAGDVDPLWVFRLSRPPVGVCLDHLRFAECGPLLGVEDLDTAEEVLGVTLPAAYRAFLLNYNAGVIEPHEMPDTEHAYALCEAARAFYPLGSTFDPMTGRGMADVVEMMDHLRSDEMTRFGNPTLPINRFIPLGFPMSEFDILLLGVAPEDFGKVYLLVNLQDDGLDADNLSEAAASLPEFLTALKPVWGN
jgi:uncharacterized protein (TIGR02996 family)